MNGCSLNLDKRIRSSCWDSCQDITATAPISHLRLIGLVIDNYKPGISPRTRNSRGLSWLEQGLSFSQNKRLILDLWLGICSGLCNFLIQVFLALHNCGMKRWLKATQFRTEFSKIITRFSDAVFFLTKLFIIKDQ